MILARATPQERLLCEELLAEWAEPDLYAFREGDYTLGALSARVCSLPRVLWVTGIAMRPGGYDPAKQQKARDLVLGLARSLGCPAAVGRVTRPGLSRLYEKWGGTVIGRDMKTEDPIYKVEVPHGRR